MKIKNSRFKISYLNEKGIALVLVLVLALISLAIVSAMLFMATQGTVISGAQKFYGTAGEASVGAVELTTDYLSTMGTFSLLGVGITGRCNCGDPLVTTDNTDASAGGLRTCRCDKLCNPRNDWAASGVAWSCDDNTTAANLQVDLDPTINPDFSFTLGDFTVFTKVVDTVRGNTDLGSIVSSGELGGTAVVASQAGIVKPPHNPYLYRMEIQAEDTDNPRELSKISVLYGY